MAKRTERFLPILAAAFGLAVGIVTAPIALVAWPIFAAWFLYNEEKGEE